MNYETTELVLTLILKLWSFYDSRSIRCYDGRTTNLIHMVKFNIYSDSKRVKTILEDLFFNRLDLHTSLPMFTRNTCKYGDNFVYLNIDETQCFRW
jgi:hypothetical protein